MRAVHDWELWSTSARLVVDDPAALPAATRIVDEVLAEIDAAANRFRTDSEISRAAPRLPDGVEVSGMLALLVRRAQDAAALTGGLVDPTLGRTLDALGYDRDIRLVLDNERQPRAAIVAARPGWRSLVLRGRLLTLPGHLAVDLGATAKACAADLATSRVAERLGCPVLLALGGDIATAGPEPEDGWSVLVEDGPDEPAERVRIRAGSALATSSTLHRRWRRGDAWLHHIIDPRTGLSAAPVWRTASVAAESCLVANAFATAAIVLGDRAPGWLDGRADARLVGADGAITRVGAWPVAADADAAGAVHEARHVVEEARRG